MKNWLIKLLGGHTSKELDEAKVIGTERLGQLKRFEQFKLQEVDQMADAKLNALLSTVNPDKIVTLDKTHGIIYIGGKRADEARLMGLKSEAEFLLSSEIWQLIYEGPKELAQRQMFVSSESLDDLKKGKSILYTLSTQKNIIDILNAHVAKK